MEQAFYYTTDIEVASALNSVGYTVFLEVNNPSRITFYFNKGEIPGKNLDTAVQSYWNGALIGSFKDFATNRKSLLTRVKEHQKEH